MSPRPSPRRPKPRPKAGSRPAPAGSKPGAAAPKGRRPVRVTAPTPQAPRPAAKGATPAPAALHVARADVLAEAAVAAAVAAEAEVFRERKRADRAIASTLRLRRDLANPDKRFVAQAVMASFRWRGWVEGAGASSVEERLLLSWLLDAPTVHPVCRVWAHAAGRDASRLVAFGDAPSWTARAEGLKRWVGGRTVNADPWRLFPDWLRANLPLPPGGGPPKAKYLELLAALQARPSLWVRAQGPGADGVFDELRGAGLKPWVHRALTLAARLEPDADVYHLPAFTRGALEIQDVSSQAVALVCDPDPGERWWDACAGAGGKALHLAALMAGKGVVVATDVSERRLKETVRRARKGPFRNVTTKVWDGTGRHVSGKPKSYDGVLVDAPCSAIGTWRRNPDARWSLDAEAIPRLAALQLQLLRAAAAGVKTGGTLVYSVCTLTPAETQGVVRAFLESVPAFRLDPFPNPFTGAPTPGSLQIWPQDADGDAMFVARLVRVPDAPRAAE